MKYVIKASGEKELFSKKKIYESALNGGATSRKSQEIADILFAKTKDLTATSDILKQIKELLPDQKTRIRFNLKEGIRRLGPSGFPFEKFVGCIFERLGFEVRVNQHIQGALIKDYEIDFTAKKGNMLYLGECKFRNLAGEKVHSQEALANYARYLDILNGPYANDIELKTILVTNTKLTQDARNYSLGVGVDIISWRYPYGAGLEHLIEKFGLYPITILPSLSVSLRDIFYSEGLMLAEDVLNLDVPRFSRKFKVASSKLEKIKEEARALLQ